MLTLSNLWLRNCYTLCLKSNLLHFMVFEFWTFILLLNLAIQIALCLKVYLSFKSTHFYWLEFRVCIYETRHSPDYFRNKAFGCLHYQTFNTLYPRCAWSYSTFNGIFESLTYTENEGSHHYFSINLTQAFLFDARMLVMQILVCDIFTPTKENKSD